MKKVNLLVVVCLLLMRIPVSLAADAPAQPQGELSVEEQTAKGFEIFQQIYKLTEEGERAKMLPQIEAAYLEIITKYPKAAIVHESYWRLMTIYLVEHTPPQFQKADNLYRDFTRKYPDSQTKGLLSDTLANSYYKHAQWDPLLRLLTPSVKQFITTGTLSRPQDLFLYTEAKLNLGDLAEAEKGYKLILTLAPESKEAKTAKTRLESIEKQQKKTP